jgi:hypothetical protein
MAYQMDITHVEHAPKTEQALIKGQTLTLQDGKAFVLARHRYMKTARNSSELPKRQKEMPADEVGELLVWLQPDD